MKSILLRTGHAGKDAKHNARPDFEFDTLKQAVDFLAQQHNPETTR